MVTADDFVTDCNGTANCVVEPGIYNVINHTTGQRFEGIEVTDTSGSDVDVDVDGLRVESLHTGLSGCSNSRLLPDRPVFKGKYGPRRNLATEKSLKRPCTRSR